MDAANVTMGVCQAAKAIKTSTRPSLENFSQKFELVLEVKGERQLACISVAAGSKGYTRPTWTSGVCFYQTSKVSRIMKISYPNGVALSLSLAHSRTGHLGSLVFACPTLSANRELHDVKDWINAIMLWTIPGVCPLVRPRLRPRSAPATLISDTVCNNCQVDTFFGFVSALVGIEIFEKW
ncbi:hypothetical protein PCH_Pc21g00780 [Penicillium rubens Wisconsin 54-1255]|uniref:Uncharacterized protein n=1 Tax=Penicillium rubens (strain ATCC 28089 / DSM 1075 / NRRL 1951 / Wisconsin 54-1255) TaxID=500485 RepID=B6HHG1_PENRW|nr:hypothetical protein PCH_Pc21g00780 [Penicillium rubens Wisconsin 54-1255]